MKLYDWRNQDKFINLKKYQLTLIVKKEWNKKRKKTLKL